MTTLSLERIRELDTATDADQEVRDFLRSVRLVTFCHDDNGETIRELSSKLDIPLKDFSAYVWLQIYIAELSMSCDDVPDSRVVAEQFGIDCGKFVTYLEYRAELFSAELEAQDLQVDDSRLSVDERKELLEDLLEEAADGPDF